MGETSDQELAGCGRAEREKKVRGEKLGGPKKMEFLLNPWNGRNSTERLLQPSSILSMWSSSAGSLVISVGLEYWVPRKRIRDRFDAQRCLRECSSRRSPLPTSLFNF